MLKIAKRKAQTEFVQCVECSDIFPEHEYFDEFLYESPYGDGVKTSFCGSSCLEEFFSVAHDTSFQRCDECSRYIRFTNSKNGNIQFHWDFDGLFLCDACHKEYTQ